MRTLNMCKLSYVIKCVAILILATSFVIFQSQASVCPTNARNVFYPSFDNSSAFVQCTNTSTNGVNLSCPNGQAFKPRTSPNDKSPLCVSINTEYGKAVFDCSGTNGNGTYSGDQTLYVTCQNGKPIDLQECPQGEYFLESIHRCNLTCAVQYKIGSFALGGRNYYTCEFDYGTLLWILTTHSCPTNERFDEDYQFCLPDVVDPVGK